MHGRYDTGKILKQMFPSELRVSGALFSVMMPVFLTVYNGHGNIRIRQQLLFNPFLPTVPTFAVRETDVSRHNGGPSGAPLKPLRDDSALRALSSLRGLKPP